MFLTFARKYVIINTRNKPEGNSYRRFCERRGVFRRKPQLFMNVTWNPWHGCHKISPGCKNCYVYRQDARYERDSSRVTKNKTFYLPIEKNKNGEYKLKREGDGIVYLCFSSDFFLEDADSWRNECWKMIKQRSELEFLFITKRIHRFYDCIPHDWGAGYDNVHICCTCEDQDRADYRLPIFLDAPIKKKINSL